MGESVPITWGKPPATEAVAGTWLSRTKQMGTGRAARYRPTGLEHLLDHQEGFEGILGEMGAAECERLEVELRDLCELVMVLVYKVNLWAFARDCLGVRQLEEGEPDYMEDPSVRQWMLELGRKVLDWIFYGHEQKSTEFVLLMLPRETLKTTGGTETVIPFVHNHFPDLDAFISSATHEDMSVPMAGVVKGHWEGATQHALLTKVFGRFEPDAGTKWTGEFMITRKRRQRGLLTPTLKPFSVQKGGTSGHYKLGVLDDPCTLEALEKFGPKWFDRQWTHWESLAFVVKKTGLLIIPLTRYGPDDLPGRIIKAEILPWVEKAVQMGAPSGRLPGDFHQKWWKYANKVPHWTVIMRHAEFDEDLNPQETFPICWPFERVKAVKTGKSALFNMTQLNNIVGQDESNPVKELHTRHIYVPYNRVPWNEVEYWVLVGDFAFKDMESHRRDRGDWNVMFACAMCRGKVYVIRGWHSKTSSPRDVIEAYQGMLKWLKFDYDERFRHFTFDRPTGGYDGGSVKTMWREAAAEIGRVAPNLLPMHRTKSKPNRLLEAAVFWAEGRLKFVEGCVGAPEAIRKMLMIMLALEDDHADCLADLFTDDVWMAGERWEDPEERGSQSLLLPVAHGSVKDGRWRPETRVRDTMGSRKGLGVPKGGPRKGGLLS